MEQIARPPRFLTDSAMSGGENWLGGEKTKHRFLRMAVKINCQNACTALDVLFQLYSIILNGNSLISLNSVFFEKLY